MEPVAALGLLKMDFLGLVNLAVLAKARDLIAERHGFQFHLSDIPLDDAKAFDLLSRGETVGVFQLEGGGMTRYIKELKPTTVGDVAAMIALYRPGPMEHISTFIDAKHGRIPVTYVHPALQEILEETYGVIVYQDQVLHIARTFAGYTLGEADIVRKAMGKKIPEIMAEEREKFLAGALARGYDKETAERVFALVEPFAGYAFNKAHSVSYGLISYWTAYLKANYASEYMVALLNAYAGHSDRVASAIAECQRLGIPVLAPNINKGRSEFTIEAQDDGSDAVRFGMGAVKNVGTAAVDAVLASRDKLGAFESLESMCREADMGGLNRKTLECLIKTGAFDDFGDRAALLDAAERILSFAQSESRLRASNQASMFDMFGETSAAPLAKIEMSGEPRHRPPERRMGARAARHVPVEHRRSDVHAWRRGLRAYRTQERRRGEHGAAKNIHGRADSPRRPPIHPKKRPVPGSQPGAHGRTYRSAGLERRDAKDRRALGRGEDSGDLGNGARPRG